MKKHILTALGVVLLCAVSLADASGAEIKMTKPTVAQLDRLFAHFNNATPGVAAAVDHKGKIVYQRGFGMSNLEHGVPIRTDSVFHIASISKQFTAMAVVLLELEGRLSFEDDIRQHIPEVPDFGETITLRHLANHTSGLRDQWALLDLAGWRAEDIKTQEDVLELVKRQKDLNFKPGAEYLYCNTGFTLLAIAVHRVSGQSLREFAEERIFRPLGMHRTHFHDDMSEIVEGRTQAYVPGRSGTYRISIPDFNTYGATSLFTTVEDLALWSRNFTHKRVGGEEGIARLLKKGVLNSGEEIPYALGILHGEDKGLRTVGHGGADAGYRSYFVMYPEQELSIMIFGNVNSSNPGGLARQAADILLKDFFTEKPPPAKPRSKRPRPKSATLTPEQQAEYTGRFYSEELDVFYAIVRKDKNLYLRRRKFRDGRLFVRENDLMVWAGWEIRFFRGPAEKVSGFTLTRGRIRNLKFVRIEHP